MNKLLIALLMLPTMPLMPLVTPASAQKTPNERCLALGDRANPQHVDNCVRRYGTRAEQRKWFRGLADDFCTEMTADDPARKAERQRCIDNAMRKPAKLCGEYLGIECKK